MVFLGVDPGFQITGFGILKKVQNSIILLDYGALRLPVKKDLSVRIGLFFDFFHGKIKEYGITDISLETPFLGKNAQNFLKLGYLRGILYLLANQHKAILHEFSPREVKQAVTGYGGADKLQVARVIMQLFPRFTAPKTLDTTDALAISLCGLWRKKNSLFPSLSGQK